MPIVLTTAYSTVESILLDARALANDMEVQGGDVLTDAAPATLRFVSLAYRRIQSYLAQWGVETYAAYTWLVGVPANASGDPESRIIVSDSGTILYTPTGIGEISYALPVLPDDLVAPLRLRERQSGTTNFAVDMIRRNDRLTPLLSQGTRLFDWQWINDTLIFRGATQTQDVELKYEKQLAVIGTVNDPIPIRGVDNAAAYRVAYEFAKSKGGAIADNFGAEGQQELDLLVNRSVRERQRIKHRRRPFRGIGRSNYRR